MKILAIVVLVCSFVFGAVDINSANQSELMSLKGIGAKKAEAIVSYRKGHCFKKAEDLTAVKGIGSKFIAKNKANIKVGSCKK
ncbi:ComEA family DNA-binding protein [Sulfurimonas paralvinellae]|uniref:Helix-hairpin-helix domain-containing protein n=1 Tax=Sulfurimonas paralvinellae TaxID=317658 RepID=A0A7M1B8W4_9BACT|nr:helix-hairpin-helix domain-containing protein [Sulfurimonas paralvinellae]QOP46071.1 helix-hairpin-helix domain-containing protein [Sulfurimonas paralvinellae]